MRMYGPGRSLGLVLASALTLASMPALSADQSKSKNNSGRSSGSSAPRPQVQHSQPQRSTPAGNSAPRYTPPTNNSSPRTYTPANRTPSTPSTPSGGKTFGRPGGSSSVRSPSTTGSYPGGRTFHAPQGSSVRPGSNGTRVYSHNGMDYHTNSSGRLTSISKPGMNGSFGSNGRVNSVSYSRNGAQTTSTRSFGGGRTVVSVRSDHTRVVSYGPGHGYIERPMARAGFVQRTYIYGGRSYVSVYRTSYWHGFGFYSYVPPVYFGIGFYGWAYNPWPAPVIFSWGWRARPWFGFYGGYFQPLPYYPSAALWLTDYMLAEDMQAAYEARMAAQQAAQYGPPPPPDVAQNGTVPLSPEVKQAIAEEVRQQLAAERAASQQPGYPPPAASPTSAQVPDALDPKQRIFVVSTAMDVVTTGGQNCALTSGDIILRTSDSVSSDGKVGVNVLSAKPGDCPINAGTSVDLATLQEMHNQFAQQVGAGMQQLASNQGRNGVPAGPPASPRPVPAAQAQPDPAASVNSQLSQQQQDAQRAEAEIQQAANAGN